MRRKHSKQRWAQQYPDDDLAHGGRLPQSFGKHAADPAREHDDGELQQSEIQDELIRMR